jgi:hypothetical protein
MGKGTISEERIGGTTVRKFANLPITERSQSPDSQPYHSIIPIFHHSIRLLFKRLTNIRNCAKISATMNTTGLSLHTRNQEGTKG